MPSLIPPAETPWDLAETTFADVFAAAVARCRPHVPEPPTEDDVVTVALYLLAARPRLAGRTATAVHRKALTRFRTLGLPVTFSRAAVVVALHGLGHPLRATDGDVVVVRGRYLTPLPKDWSVWSSAQKARLSANQSSRRGKEPSTRRISNAVATATKDSDARCSVIAEPF